MGRHKQALYALGGVVAIAATLVIAQHFVPAYRAYLHSANATEEPCPIGPPAFCLRACNQRESG